MDCDLLIIGSGFGGSVCACRAAEAGLRVIVLERGRRMSEAAYEEMAAGRLPIFHAAGRPGLMELHRLKGLLALSASAVGGGSNVYTAVTIRPPEEIFDDRWPAEFTPASLAPYYDRVEAMIAPTPVPHALPRTRALEAIGAQTRTAVARLPLSMEWPADASALAGRFPADGVYRELATWLRGGRASRKRTLEATYLARAEACGAEIRPLHEVRAIAPAAEGYRVAFRRCDEGDAGEGSLRAPRVILAAGTLNSVRLLLHGRDVLGTLPGLSRTLGAGFYTNGDFGGLLAGPAEPPPPDAGPPVTAWIDRWRRDRLYVMETGLVPYDFGSFAGLLNPASWFSGMRLAPVKRPTWSFGVMGACENPGRLVLGRRGALVHRHDAGRGAAFFGRTMAALRELADAAGGRLLTPPAVMARRLPITVHPLGGAAMADAPESGVTDAGGEVFGHPGLFVVDGSLLPVPTGAPPSMTIAALAERLIERILRP